MNRFLAALLIAVLVPLPAFADAGISLLPQTQGQRIHYRLAETHLTANGPVSATSVFDLVRRAGTTIVIERANANGTPNQSVLKLDANGALTLAEDASALAADSDVVALLANLNLAVSAARSSDATAHAPWSANLTIPAAGPAQTAVLTLAPSNATATDFDFSGTGQAQIAEEPAPLGRSGGRRSGGGIGGFPGGGGGGFPGGGGGGFPGGAGVGGQRGEDNRQPQRSRNRSPIADVVHVEGHVSRGNVTRVAVTQTRSVTIENMPFLNTATVTVTVDR